MIAVDLYELHGADPAMLAAQAVSAARKLPAGEAVIAECRARVADSRGDVAEFDVEVESLYGRVVA